MNSVPHPRVAFWSMIVRALFAGTAFGVFLITILLIVVPNGTLIVLLPLFILAAFLIAILMMPFVGPVAGLVARPFYDRGIKSYSTYTVLGFAVGIFAIAIWAAIMSAMHGDFPQSWFRELQSEWALINPISGAFGGWSFAAQLHRQEPD